MADEMKTVKVNGQDGGRAGEPGRCKGERVNSGAEEDLNKWTADEIETLKAALVKFPSGAADRWVKIAQALPSRTVKDVMAKVRQGFGRGRGCPVELA